MSPDWTAKEEGSDPVPYADLTNLQSLNLYQYMRNNPLAGVDKDGHCFWDLCIGESALIYAGGAALTAAYLTTPSGQQALHAGAQLLQMGTNALSNVFNSSNGNNSNAAAPASTPAPEIIVDGSKHPESAQHVADAQAAGQPSEVTIDRTGAKGNRADALSGTSAVPGQHRDEYPPAVTKEGGSGASVRPISPSDNTGAGASMGNQMRQYPNGTKVTIKPINVPRPPQAQ